MSETAIPPDTCTQDDLTCMDATAQAQLIRTGEISALELVDQTIARFERINPKINATASTNFEQARARARGQLPGGVFAGVPTLIKDLMPYPGHAAGFGTCLFDGVPAQGGSPYTEALDASGLIVLGKSTTSEFGLLGTTESTVKGVTRNPWDLTRSPGGSSGGAAAAVAAGLVPVAHASDGGGSIRGPASLCGLFGFKPSRDRTVSNGMPADLPTAGLLSEHCLSRSVRDSANWLMAAERPDMAVPLSPTEIATPNPPDRLRIGLYLEDSRGRSPDPEIVTATQAAAHLCEDLGHEVFNIAPPVFDVDATAQAFFALNGAVLAGFFDQFAQMMGPEFDEGGFEPYTRTLVQRARMLTPDKIHATGAAMANALASVSASAETCDVMLCPTIPFAAFPLGQYDPSKDPDRLNAFVERIASYTFPASLAGWPAMSVPLGQTADGLPIGCHFAAAQGQDAHLFALAFQLEQAAPWQPRLTALAQSL